MKRIVHGITSFMVHPLMKSSAIVLAGSMLANVGSYAYHLVVGRLLGPEQYGTLSSLFSLSYLLNVPSLVLQTVLTKHIAEFRAKKEYGKAKRLSLMTSKMLFVATLTGGVVLLPFAGLFAEFLKIDSTSAILLMYLTSALWLFTVVQVSLLQGFQLFMGAMILTNAGVILRLVGGAIGGMFGVIETVFAGVVSGCIGLLMYFFPLAFVYNAKSEPTGLTKKGLFSYSWPSLITMLGVTSLYSSDIILAKHYLDPISAGFYAALSVMGKIIFFASSSVSYVTFPEIAERTKQRVNASKLISLSLVIVAAVSGAITLGYMLFPHFALSLLFGPTYRDGAQYLGLFGMFISLYSLCYVLIMTLLGTGKMLVWVFVGLAAMLQVIAITLFHRDIADILTANITVVTGLFVSLLLYYRHEIKDH